MTAESTPQPRNRPLRWAVGCLVLFAAAAILQYALFDKVRYIAGLFIEDPLAVAQGYADAGHLRQAADYIDFYQSLPLVTEADARRLDPLKDEIAKERSTLTYRTSEVARGFFLSRGEEEYGIAAGLISELTSVADIRDLAREGAAWANDEEVDVFTTTLAGAGLALTIASVGPQAALAAPAKSGLALVKNRAPHRETLAPHAGEHRALRQSPRARKPMPQVSPRLPPRAGPMRSSNPWRNLPPTARRRVLPTPLRCLQEATISQRFPAPSAQRNPLALPQDACCALPAPTSCAPPNARAPKGCLKPQSSARAP